MENLQVGTELVIVKSSPERCNSLQEGQHLTVSSVGQEGRYNAGHWNLRLTGGVLAVEGLDVELEVVQDKPTVQDTTDYKRIALMQHLSCAYDDVEYSNYGDCIYLADGEEYRVLTDSEADEAFDEALDSVLDEVILPDLEYVELTK